MLTTLQRERVRRLKRDIQQAWADARRPSPVMLRQLDMPEARARAILERLPKGPGRPRLFPAGVIARMMAGSGASRQEARRVVEVFTWEWSERLRRRWRSPLQRRRDPHGGELTWR